MRINALIHLVIAFLARYTATAAYSRRNAAKVITFRGGSTSSRTKTTEQQPTTKSDTTTTSWRNKFQRIGRKINAKNNSTIEKDVIGIDSKVTDVQQESSLKSNHSDVSTTQSPVVHAIDSRNTSGWFRQRQPWSNNSKNDASKSNNTSTAPNEIANTTATSKRRWPMQQQRTSTVTKQVPQNTTVTPTTNSTTETVTTPTNDSKNSTGTSEQQELSLSPANNGVIMIGSNLPPQQYYRGQPIIVRGSSSMSNPAGTTTNPTNSVVIVLIEFLTSIVGKAMYLWFFTWLTKRMAQEEEGIIMPTQHYVWERLNDRYCRDAVALQTILREPPLGVSYKQWHRQHIRKVQQSNNHRLSKNVSPTPKLVDTFTRTVVVVEISTSGSSSSTVMDATSTINFQSMPDVVSFLLQQQRQHAFGTLKATGQAMPLEIVFIINSPGGEVSTFGLAAAQMRRLRNQPNITTTVCVDKYAASGGFMIASQADKLVAAPFATIGSIGVIIEGLNFYELAKRYGVQPLVIKAGESKNPLSQWGPVTRQDLAQEQSRLEKVHIAFKEFVTEGRPDIVANAQQVMDGSVYLGVEAQRLGLIDVVMTTDEYIFDRIEAGDRVLRLHRSLQVRFNRQLRFSPLDILPHLRSWLSSSLKHFASIGEI